MYQDVTLRAQQTIREFEDLKNKLKEGVSKEKLDDVIWEILRRTRFFVKYNVKRAREYEKQILQLKHLIDTNQPTMGLLTELEELMIKLRDKAGLADKKKEQVEEFAFA